MNSRWAICCFVSLTALAACQSKDSAPPSSAGGSPGKVDAPTAKTGESKVDVKAEVPKSRTATAEEVAAKSRGDVKCPATIATAARAAGAPVDDVVGIRPGLTYEEAVNLVLCDNPLLVVEPEKGRGFEMKTFGQSVRQGFNGHFAEAEKTSQQIMKEMRDESLARSANQIRYDMTPGQVKYYVTTMGLPGQERVLSVAREEWFQEGRNPTFDSVREALITKYGALTRDREYSPGRELLWAYDPRGRLVTETSPLYAQCNVDANPRAGVRLTPDCGTVVAAHIIPLKDNPALAQTLQVTSVNEADGMAAIAATEEGLQAQDAARRSKEVDEAANNADKPKL